jgi:hypothetical protein
MDDASGRRWLMAAVGAAVVYAVVGVVFAWPATQARAWRLAAWLVSAVVYGLHILSEWHEGRTPAPAAFHVASGVALGSFGLAMGAIMHSLSIVSSPRHQRLLLIALVAWPVITSVPAFLVALGVSVVYRRCRHI